MHLLSPWTSLSATWLKFTQILSLIIYDRSLIFPNYLCFKLILQLYEHEPIPVFHLLSLLVPQTLEAGSHSLGNLSIICWHLLYHAPHISLINEWVSRKCRSFSVSICLGSMILYHFPKDCTFRSVFLNSHKHFMTMVFNFFCIRSLFDTQRLIPCLVDQTLEWDSGDHLDPDVSSDPVATWPWVMTFTFPWRSHLG